MTSHHRRSDNEHSMFTSKTPHFFKVILDETFRDGKLGIPTNFVRKYGRQLSSPISLEVPSGAVWQVELTKCDERVWLQKGWQEFAEHNSLEYGYFLVFRYEGNAHFHVLIFDMSASEIEYPHTSTAEEDDVFDNASVCKKSKRKSDIPYPQAHKEMKVDSPNEIGTHLKSKLSAPATMGGGVTGRRSPQIEVLDTAGHLTADEKTKALQKASGFKTKNPFFMVVMQPSCVSFSYRMCVPDSFARKYFKMTQGNVILRIANGQSWPAKYYCRPNIDNPRAQLRVGWQEFAMHNALEVGDVCVFELTRTSPEILLKVVIYKRFVEDAIAARQLAGGSIAYRVKKRRSFSDIETNCLQNQHAIREYGVPKIEQNENIHTSIEILDDFPLNQITKKKLPFPGFQPCKMMKTNPSQVEGIELGKQKKSLDFQYSTNELGGEFKFSGKDESEGMSGAQKCPKPDFLSRMQPLTTTEKKIALKRAMAFKSANPSFTVVMQPSYVLPGGSLSIPSQFVKRHFKKNGEVTLRVSDGRTWIVDYNGEGDGQCPKGKFRTRSWRAFVLDNNLKVGDVCVFELIKANGNSFDVVIFPDANIASCSSSKLDSRSQCKEAEDDGSIEILEYTAPCQKTREKSSVQCPRPQKMMKINMIHKTEKILESECMDPRFRPFCNKASGIKLEKPKGSTSSSCCKQEVGGLKPAKRTGRGTENGWECPEQAEILRSQKLTARVKANTLRIAKAFNSKNPFFLVVIQPSHISSNYKMCIPSNFARKYFTKTHGGETVLCLSDGKSWSVRYYRRGDDGNPQGQFSGGWKKFALDNNLVVGDVCVFELLKGADISFKVFIHRVVDVANCDPS